jgi:hypothetical protein
MASQPPTPERHVDRDGVTRIQKKRTGNGTWLVWLALGVTALCLVLSAWLVSSPGPVPDTGEPSPVRVAENRPAPSPTRSAPPTPRPEVRPAQGAPEAPPTPQEAPAMEQDSAPSGPAEGINLYRPGTKKLKQGLIVPEGFELPPGYLRHYQSTDNGEGVKPILMFHPDYKPVDSKGQPVEIPESRVVPPELAPAGMPIEVLELPEGPEGVEPIP